MSRHYPSLYLIIFDLTSLLLLACKPPDECKHENYGECVHNYSGYSGFLLPNLIRTIINVVILTVKDEGNIRAEHGHNQYDVDDHVPFIGKCSFLLLQEKMKSHKSNENEQECWCNTNSVCSY